VLFTVFFSQGSVHHEFTPEGNKTNKKYNLQVLWCLYNVIHHKRPEKWPSGNWKIHHDNTPAHSFQLMHHFLAKHKIPNKLQLAYSPNLALCEFFSFPKIEIDLK
jgi:hypothetical protein